MRAQLGGNKIAELWSKEMHKVLRDDLQLVTVINDTKLGYDVRRYSTHSSLTVGHGQRSYLLTNEHGISIWRRFSQGYQIPRETLREVYVDLTLKVTPRVDAQADTAVALAAKLSHKHTTPIERKALSG